MAARDCTLFSCSELSLPVGSSTHSLSQYSVVPSVCHLAAVDESSVIAGCDNRAIFLALLKYYTIVLTNQCC